MNYQILARKYRPQNFGEVIGQEKIITLLQNALKKNRIGQSYIFSGPRGVGKTTTARILVKYLNCETTGTAIPCNECSSCTEINRGISLDYLEIDGASNRGIDQIRELNEQLNFASPKGKYRVFVIDEVHMLTTEAFNALLKSLEEPPQKFIFVLCTTESYRIPLTIRSRCQQLFFGYIDIHRIVSHLELLLTKEGHDFIPESLLGLAKKSEGSIRDAENLLEKVIAYSDGKTITSELVEEVLGETPIEKKYAFLNHLITDDLKANVDLFRGINTAGYSINEFFYHIIDTISTLIYYKSEITDGSILGISNEELQQLKIIQGSFSLHELFSISDLLFDTIRTLKNTTHYQATVNYMLIKLHRYKNLITPSELKENILQLSKYIAPDAQVKATEDSSVTKIMKAEEPIKLELNTKPSSIENPSQPKSFNSSINFGDSKEAEEQLSTKNEINKPITSTIETNSKHQASTNGSVNVAPENWEPWTEGDYKTFLQVLKEDDQDLFRLAITFRFINMEGKVLILENSNNYDLARVEKFTQEFSNYLNASKHLKHPLLATLTGINSQESFRVQIKQNIVQSNLAKIKKIFPIQE